MDTESRTVKEEKEEKKKQEEKEESQGTLAHINSAALGDGYQADERSIRIT